MGQQQRRLSRQFDRRPGRRLDRQFGGMKKFLCGLAIATLTLCGCQWIHPIPPVSMVSQAQPSLAAAAQQRGVSWVGGRQPVTRDDFSSLIENHVNWIVQTPFGWQEDYDFPQLRLKTRGVYWGETDIGLQKTTQIAQSLGIKTLLKPHIWLLNPSDGKWRTEIEMRSEQDWQTWFNNYRKFILHYAQFAEKQGIPALCIGTELQTTAIQREEDWRQLIRAIRQVYSGQLTYAANWYQAFEEIQFWDELDFIGIQAYFPLTDQANPTLEELKQGWQGWFKNGEIKVTLAAQNGPSWERVKGLILSESMLFESAENRASSANGDEPHQ